MKRRNKTYNRHELHTLAIWARRTKVACELIPPTAAIIMLVHCILLYFDIRLPYAEIIALFLAAIMMFILSRALGFCRLHRIFIIYNFTMLACIHFQREVGFRDFLHPAHAIMIAIGIFLIIKLIINKCKK